MIRVEVKKGSSVEHAIKILRKEIDREGTLKLHRRKQFYEKPSSIRKVKKQKAKYFQKLEAERNRECR